ncbi:MAG TPA: hypothetical protein V6C99_05570 [Oculatellaceae cyanobacterium]
MSISFSTTQHPLPNNNNQSPKAEQLPRFQGVGRLFTPMALQQVGIDTGNVLVPKLPFVRSKTQLFEEIFLEVVEDLAFYLTIPIAGTLLAERFFAKRFGHTPQEIGSRLGRKALEAPRNLIAAKAGVFLGAVSIAAGFEYLIQHVKNVITAKKFHTKNFTAVAGFEPGRTQLQSGETDPVEKAKRRIWQTAVLTGAGLLSAVLAPKSIMKNDRVFATAKKLIQYLDFGKRPGNAPFDLSGPILGLVIGSGVISYIDAARDNLERKETATRLLFVVPGLLFGKALASDLLAWGLERFGKVGTGTQRKTIQQHLAGTGISFTHGNPLKKAMSPDTFMDFNVVDESGEALFKKLKETGLPDEIQYGIMKKFNQINFPWSYLVSAGIFGSGVCWLAFRQTKQRYEKQKLQQALTGANQQQSRTPLPFGSGRPASAWNVFQQEPVVNAKTPATGTITTFNA